MLHLFCTSFVCFLLLPRNKKTPRTRAGHADTSCGTSRPHELSATCVRIVAAEGRRRLPGTRYAHPGIARQGIAPKAAPHKAKTSLGAGVGSPPSRWRSTRASQLRGSPRKPRFALGQPQKTALFRFAQKYLFGVARARADDETVLRFGDFRGSAPTRFLTSVRSGRRSRPALTRRKNSGGSPEAIGLDALISQKPSQPRKSPQIQKQNRPVELNEGNE